MSTFAPITDVIHNTSWGKKRTQAITGLWVHHQADGGGTADIGYMVEWNSRDSHPTYALDDADRVHGIVHPDRSPASTGRGYDANSVSVELANSGGEATDWAVTDAALEKLAHIIAHHANQSPRRAHAIEVNDMGRTQAGFFVGWHSQTKSTECPGKYVRARIPQIVARANEILNGLRGGAPAATPSGPSAPATPAGPSDLVVDGIWGALTTKALQRALGVTADGKIGPVTTRALQRRIGVTADGVIGPVTRRALQRHLGVTQDGIWGPITTRALQTRLNQGTF